VGIIGAGHLIRHMMPALAKSGRRFLVSERNRAVSAELASRFGCEVAPESAEIVRRASPVILAVRPHHAVEAATGLPWRVDQTVLSLCAGIRAATLQPAVAPAKLVLAMPVVAAEFGESPTLLWPEEEECRALLEPCGPVIGLDHEALFPPASVLGVYFCLAQALIAEITHWTVTQGLDPEEARLLVSQMTRAAATVVRERTDTPIEALVAELATPRSFSRAGLELLDARDAFAPWREACEEVARKLGKGT
jgi:pyrroline-5-carboxylate reductase